tara:strand:+ start:1126 stop:1962 length:837 start_codon:yes stop_codon:yes gene_type:complete
MFYSLLLREKRIFLATTDCFVDRSINKEFWKKYTSNTLRQINELLEITSKEDFFNKKLIQLLISSSQHQVLDGDCEKQIADLNLEDIQNVWDTIFLNFYNHCIQYLQYLFHKKEISLKKNLKTASAIAKICANSSDISFQIYKLLHDSITYYFPKILPPKQLKIDPFYSTIEQKEEPGSASTVNKFSEIYNGKIINISKLGFGFIRPEKPGRDIYFKLNIAKWDHKVGDSVKYQTSIYDSGKADAIWQNLNVSPREILLKRSRSPENSFAKQMKKRFI